MAERTTAGSPTLSEGTGLTNAVQKLRRGDQLSRRGTTIATLRDELELERDTLERFGDDSYALDCYEQAFDSLDEAAAALRRDDPISSRRAYYAAQRLTVLGLSDVPLPEAGADASDAGLAAYRRMLLQKKAHWTYTRAGERLGDWRNARLGALLTRDGAVREDVDAVEVATAIQLVQEYYVTHDVVFEKLKKQVLYVVAMALGTLVVFLWSALGAVFGPVFATPKEMQTGGFLVYVVLVGVLGASMSAMFSLMRQLTRRAVVETRQLLDFPMAIGRVVAGAVSALALVVVLQSGLFAFEVEAGLALSLGLAAGFSEDVVRSALDSVSGRIAGSEETART